MAYYGYHRVSTNEQELGRGIMAIEAYCKNNGLVLTRIFTDKQTGKNFDRARYRVLKEDVLRTGDILIICELDRLGRTKTDTIQELSWFRENGIRVMILEIPTTLMDYSSFGNETARLLMEMANNIMIEVYATIAQQEVEKRAMRQAQGYEALKLRGEWDKLGRPKRLKQEEFEQHYKKFLNGEIRAFELIRTLGLSKATYYRYKKQYELKSRIE